MLSLSCQEWKVDERVGTEGPKGEGEADRRKRRGGAADSPTSQQPLGSFLTGSPARPGQVRGLLTPGCAPISGHRSSQCRAQGQWRKSLDCALTLDSVVRQL